MFCAMNSPTQTYNVFDMKERKAANPPFDVLEQVNVCRSCLLFQKMTETINWLSQSNYFSTQHYYVYDHRHRSVHFSNK